MPRRREVPKRDVLPDPKYNSKLVAKFMNNVMRRGKKSLAEQIFTAPWISLNNAPSTRLRSFIRLWTT